MFPLAASGDVARRRAAIEAIDLNNLNAVVMDFIGSTDFNNSRQRTVRDASLNLRLVCSSKAR